MIGLRRLALGSRCWPAAAAAAAASERRFGATSVRAAQLRSPSSAEMRFAYLVSWPGRRLGSASRPAPATAALRLHGRLPPSRPSSPHCPPLLLHRTLLRPHRTHHTPPRPSPRTHSPTQDCEDAAKWAGHEAIAEALLHPGASWQHFRCFNRELPPLDSLSQLDGVLISGSHYSAYEGAWLWAAYQLQRGQGSAAPLPCPLGSPPPGRAGLCPLRAELPRDLQSTSGSGSWRPGCGRRCRRTRASSS